MAESVLIKSHDIENFFHSVSSLFGRVAQYQTRNRQIIVVCKGVRSKHRSRGPGNIHCDVLASSLERHINCVFINQLKGNGMIQRVLMCDRMPIALNANMLTSGKSVFSNGGNGLIQRNGAQIGVLERAAADGFQRIKGEGEAFQRRAPAECMIADGFQRIRGEVNALQRRTSLECAGKNFRNKGHTDLFQVAVPLEGRSRNCQQLVLHTSDRQAGNDCFGNVIWFPLPRVRRYYFGVLVINVQLFFTVILGDCINLNPCLFRLAVIPHQVGTLPFDLAAFALTERTLDDSEDAPVIIVNSGLEEGPVFAAVN